MLNHEKTAIQTIRCDLGADPAKIYLYLESPQEVLANPDTAPLHQLDLEDYKSKHASRVFMKAFDSLPVAAKREFEETFFISMGYGHGTSPLDRLMVEVGLLLDFPQATLLNPRFDEEFAVKVRKCQV